MNGGFTESDFKSLTTGIQPGAPVSFTFLAPMTVDATADPGWFKSGCYTCKNGAKFKCMLGDDGMMYAQDNDSGFMSRIIDIDGAFRSLEAHDYDFNADTIEAQFGDFYASDDTKPLTIFQKAKLAAEQAASRAADAAMNNPALQAAASRIGDKVSAVGGRVAGKLEGAAEKVLDKGLKRLDQAASLAEGVVDKGLMLAARSTFGEQLLSRAASYHALN